MTHIRNHIVLRRDKVIAIPAPPYQVVCADDIVVAPGDAVVAVSDVALGVDGVVGGDGGGLKLSCTHVWSPSVPRLLEPVLW